MSSRFFRVIAVISILFIVMVEHCFVERTHHVLFAHVFVGEHLGCLCFLAVMSGISENIHVCVLFDQLCSCFQT